MIFAEAAICLLVSVRNFPMKKGFGWKAAVLAGVTLLVMFLFPYLYSFAGDNAVYLLAINYVFGGIFIAAYCCLLYDMQLQYILFYTTIFLLSSYIANQFGYIILTAVQSAFDSINSYYRLLIESLAYIMSFAVMATIFIFRYRGKVENTRKRVLAFFLGTFLVCSLTMSEITCYLSSYDRSYVMMITLCEIFYALIITIILFSLLNQGESEAEITAIKHMWIEDKKHYEIQKESMEMINIKVHDLKHQINDIKESGELTEQTFSQLEESADIYQSIVQTGNEVLDVVLSSVSLRAQKEKIQFTCMADGSALSFMEDSDIYSFFLNMLDNALEHEETIDPEKERFMSLTIKQKDGILLIHEENLFSGEVKKDGDILSTTKEDKTNHGLGTKSMKKMVEKYRGEIEFLIQDNMFQVDVQIPMPEVSE